VTETFTIRPLRSDDVEQAVALLEAVAAEGVWIGREALPPDEAEARRRVTRDRFVQQIDDEHVAVFVADAGGEVVGHATAQLASYGTADLAMLVAEGWRGRGVGRALLDAVVSWSREHGAQKVTLQVWPHNRAARALYERAGFADEGRLRRHYRRRNGELWDAIVMGLVLDDTSPGSPFDD
jgi:putative acetyltransferase